MMYLKPILPVCWVMAGAVLAVSCREPKQKTVVKNQEISFTQEGTLQFYKKSGALITELAIEIADTPYEIETGLMYRTSMKNTQGMLFIFEDVRPRYFYMKNTQLPLDIIFLDADKKVVSFAKNAVPLDETSLPSGVPAKYVLEVNAGWVDGWSIEPGDFISVVRNASLP